MIEDRLAAFALTRRTISAAIFQNTRLEHMRTRQFSSDLDLALGSVTEFVSRVKEDFDISSAAIEACAPGSEKRAALLITHVKALLLNSGVPVRPITQAEVFSAFSFPPLRARPQLRAVAQMIWPYEDAITNRHSLDAAVLGLYAQVESIIDINLQHH